MKSKTRQSNLEEVIIGHQEPAKQDDKLSLLRRVKTDETVKLMFTRHVASSIHDFNNLLFAINGHAELLSLNQKPKSKEDKYCRIILNSCARAKLLVDQLRYLYSDQEYEVPRVNANKVMNEIIGMVEEILHSRTTIKKKISKVPCFLKVYPPELQNALLNLVVNARDAMPRGGELLFSTARITVDDGYKKAYNYARKGDYIVMKVADTGQGIPESELPNIFHPFYTTKGNKGTGMGLSNVYRFVKKYEGHINVISRIGTGTRFEMCLPENGIKKA